MRTNPLVAWPSVPVAATPVQGPRPGAADPELARACEEFEAVLVRQLLAASETSPTQQSGYGSMVTDALAGAVAESGGLGVAEALRHALSAER